MSAAVGATLPIWETRIPGERRLALAVVCQAWLDAFVSTDAAITNTDRTRIPGAVRGEARRWLTWPEHMEDREFFCDCAGIPEPKLRRAARVRLKAIKVEESTATVIALDQAFAALLERADSLDGATLDRALAELAALEATAA